MLILKYNILPMRLTSLDVFRGITIAGMILVNIVGVAEKDHIYSLLDHAEWHGCTPTDLVFPFFLFIVGVAMTFSLSKYTDGNKPTTDCLFTHLSSGGDSVCFRSVFKSLLE